MIKKLELINKLGNTALLVGAYAAQTTGGRKLIFPRRPSTRPGAMLAAVILAAAFFLHSGDLRAQAGFNSANASLGTMPPGSSSVVAKWQAHPPGLSSARLAAL